MILNTALSVRATSRMAKAPCQLSAGRRLDLHMLYAGDLLLLFAIKPKDMFVAQRRGGGGGVSKHGFVPLLSWDGC